MTTLVDPDWGTHTYSYDPDGRAVKDVSGTRTIGASYDLLGRVGCIQDAAATINATGACSAGNPLVQNSYDVSNLVLSGTTDYPKGELTKSVANTRYSDGSVASTTTSFEYDVRGRVSAAQLQIATPASWGVSTALPTYQLTSAYNDANQVTTTQTSANGVVGYATTQQYETPSGFLKGLANTSGSTLATLNYQPQGLLDSISFQSNTGSALASDQFTYDNDLRSLSSVASWQSGSGSSGTIVSQTRSYDPGSNVISLATTQAVVPGQSGSGGSEVQNFCYDEQNRLVWAGNNGTQPGAGNGTCGSGTLSSGFTGAGLSSAYAYTHLGQLWLGHANGSATTSQYLYCDSTHPHQLTGLYATGATCSSKNGQVYGSSYDSWGNVTQRSYSGVTAMLSYDSLDHFTQWNGGSTNQEWYVYDAAGNRVLKRTTGTGGTFLTSYPFGLEEHQFTSTGVANGGDKYYYSLGGRLIGELNGTTTQFFLVDGLGSPLGSVSNVAGSAAIQGNQLYDPYGYRRYHSGTVGTSKQFTGQYNDTQTGLNYYNSRYYDSIAGVFLSADTVQGNVEGMNPYAYVGGNPETWSDPSGHSFCVFICIGPNPEEPQAPPSYPQFPPIPTPFLPPITHDTPHLDPPGGGIGPDFPHLDPPGGIGSDLPPLVPPTLGPDFPAPNDGIGLRDTPQEEIPTIMPPQTTSGGTEISPTSKSNKRNPEADAAQKRAMEIGKALSFFANRFSTVGVAYMTDGEGNVRVVVAVNEGGLSHKKEIQQQLSPDEIWANEGDSGQKIHAESILLDYRDKFGLTVLGVGASHEFCDEKSANCRAMLLQEVGVEAMGQDIP